MSLTRRVSRSPWSFCSCRRLCSVLSLALMITATPVTAANVAVIDRGSPVGQSWCDLLTTAGHSCVLFPSSGPTTSLDSFDVVIALSGSWNNAGSILADYMRQGGGVITSGAVPSALGIVTDSTVQAWIGANQPGVGFDFLVTLIPDPILPGIPPGSVIAFCGDAGCEGLHDTTGHPNAVVLAEFSSSGATISILRNTWQGGRSVYLTEFIRPIATPGAFTNLIILATVRDLSLSIPATSTWGVVALTLLLASAGTVLVRRLSSHSRTMIPGEMDRGLKDCLSTPIPSCTPTPKASGTGSRLWSCAARNSVARATQAGAEKRPGGVNRALGNRPMGD